MASFSERIVGAARLNVATYEEIEADTTATGQAMVVVVLSSIAAGIGVWQGFVGGFFAGIVAALIGWFAWAFLVFLIGTKLLPEPQTRSNIPELLRTTGFSAAPGMLRFLGVIPIIGGLILLILSIWMLVAMIVAVRQALDYTNTWRAIAVAVIGWIVYVVVLAVLGTWFRPMM